MYKIVLEHDDWLVMHEWFKKLMKMRKNSKSNIESIQLAI